MSIINKSDIEYQLGDYIVTKPDTLANEKVTKFVDYYKRNIIQKFQAKRPEQISEIKGDKLFVSIKYDGHFAVFYYNANETGTNKSFFTNTPTHRMIIGSPLSKLIEKEIEKLGIKEIILAGELIASKESNFNSRTRVYDYSTYYKGSQDQLDKIGFKVFDILEIDGEDYLQKTYEARLEKMNELFKPGNNKFSLIDNWQINSTELIKYYNNYVENQKHEGLMVRFGNFGIKLKPVHSIDAVIIGFVTGRSGSKVNENQVSSTIVALKNEQNNYIVLGYVGGGLTDLQRTDLFNEFSRMKVKNKFVITNSDGKAYQMIEPKIVAEIDYLDILTDKHSGVIYEKELKFENNEWILNKEIPFISLISPRFVRMRDDKKADYNDIRIEQILDLIMIPEAKPIFKEENPPKIIEKYVLKKEMTTKTGQKAGLTKNLLKKFLIIDTNKENSNYAKYIVYFLDYSNGRTDPLDYEIYQFRDLDKAKKLYDNLINEHKKAGWDVVPTIIKEFPKPETKTESKLNIELILDELSLSHSVDEMLKVLNKYSIKYEAYQTKNMMNREITLYKIPESKEIEKEINSYIRMNEALEPESKAQIQKYVHKSYYDEIKLWQYQEDEEGLIEKFPEEQKPQTKEYFEEKYYGHAEIVPYEEYKQLYDANKNVLEIESKSRQSKFSIDDAIKFSDEKKEWLKIESSKLNPGNDIEVQKIIDTFIHSYAMGFKDRISQVKSAKKSSFAIEPITKNEIEQSAIQMLEKIKDELKKKSIKQEEVQYLYLYGSIARPLGFWVQSSLFDKENKPLLKEDWKIEEGKEPYLSYLLSKKELSIKSLKDLELKQINPPFKVEISLIVKEIQLNRITLEMTQKEDFEKHLKQDLMNALDRLGFKQIMTNDAIELTFKEAMDYLKTNLESKSKKEEEIASESNKEQDDKFRMLLNSLTKEELNNQINLYNTIAIKEGRKQDKLKGYSGLNKAELVDFVILNLDNAEKEKIGVKLEKMIFDNLLPISLQLIQNEYKIKNQFKEKIELIEEKDNELKIITKGYLGDGWTTTTKLTIQMNKKVEHICNCKIGDAGGLCIHKLAGFLILLSKNKIQQDQLPLNVKISQNIIDSIQNTSKKPNLLEKEPKIVIEGDYSIYIEGLEIVLEWKGAYAGSKPVTPTPKDQNELDKVLIDIIVDKITDKIKPTKKTGYARHIIIDKYGIIDKILADKTAMKKIVKNFDAIGLDTTEKGIENELKSKLPKKIEEKGTKLMCDKSDIYRNAKILGSPIPINYLRSDEERKIKIETNNGIKYITLERKELFEKKHPEIEKIKKLTNNPIIISIDNEYAEGICIFTDENIKFDSAIEIWRKQYNISQVIEIGEEEKVQITKKKLTKEANTKLKQDFQEVINSELTKSMKRKKLNELMNEYEIPEQFEKFLNNWIEDKLKNQ